jgi:hypothetical protein
VVCLEVGAGADGFRRLLVRRRRPWSGPSLRLPKRPAQGNWDRNQAGVKAGLLYTLTSYWACGCVYDDWLRKSEIGWSTFGVSIHAGQALRRPRLWVILCIRIWLLDQVQPAVLNRECTGVCVFGHRLGARYRSNGRVSCSSRGLPVASPLSSVANAITGIFHGRNLSCAH